MNIGKISNIPFKSAYIVSGSGGEVKKTENKIRAAAGDDVTINMLGYGYNAVDMPAYFLVTTGDDTLAYNEFASQQQMNCKSTVLAESKESKNSKKLSPDDFKTKRDFFVYKIKHDTDILIKTMQQYCDFNQVPDVLDAELVLQAIDADCFDCKNGTFIRSKGENN